jgi:hypothetical protein
MTEAEPRNSIFLGLVKKTFVGDKRQLALYVDKNLFVRYL